MAIQRKIVRQHFVRVLIFSALVTHAIHPVFAQDTKTNLYRATDPNIHYIGRSYETGADEVSLSWPGSTIKVDFEGTSVAMLLEDSKGDYPDANYIDVFIDGISIGTIRCDKSDGYYLLKEGLEDKVHTLEIYKRTDGMAGPITLKGIILDDYKKLIAPKETTDFKIEFYGDSIVSGACNEAPIYTEEEIAESNKSESHRLTNDPYDNFSTYNNYLSFGAIAARDLNAEYVCIAQGGVGLTKSAFPGYIMPELWDLACGAKAWKAGAVLDRSQLWDFEQTEPAYVLISLGGNDLQYGIEGDFKVKYTAFIKALREKYPHATFFCVTTPPRFNVEGETSKLTEEAVKGLNKAGDNNVFYYAFKEYTDYTGYIHPRVSTDEEMAAEMTKLVQNHIASNVEVTYKVGANYETGADIDLVITNNNDFPIHNWAVDFSLPEGENLSKAWQAEAKQEGEQLSFSSLDWNNTIPAHESVTFGFEVSHEKSTEIALKDITFKFIKTE